MPFFYPKIDFAKFSYACVPIAVGSYNIIGFPKLGLSANLIFLGITT
jgi:hypothetical protein